MDDKNYIASSSNQEAIDREEGDMKGEPSEEAEWVEENEPPDEDGSSEDHESSEEDEWSEAEDKSWEEDEPMEETYIILKAAVMRGEIDKKIKNFVAKYKDTLLGFRTPEVGNNIVHIAVRHQRLKVVEEVFSLRPDLLREKNNHGSTPLHEAAAFGNKETVQFLISLLESSSSSSSSSSSDSCTPESYLLEVNQDGETPLHVALRSRNLTTAKELFSHADKHQKKILVMKTHLRKETPLHLYVRYCADGHFLPRIDRVNGKVVPNQALIQELIQANVKGIFEADFEGLSPLMRAAQHGHVLVLYWMLLLYPLSMLEWRDSKGRGFLHHLKLNITENETDRVYTLTIYKHILKFPGVFDILTCSQDQDGKTPLHLAILDRDFDLAHMILEQHVYKQSKSAKKFTGSIKNVVGKAVYDLITSGHDIPQKLKYLMERASWGGGKSKNLYRAAVKLDIDAATQYMTSEADEYGDYPKSQDEHGRNILHLALQHHITPFTPPQAPDARYRPFIEEAMKRFPKLIFQKDRNGDTPLHIAAKLSSLEAIELLVNTFESWSVKLQYDDDYRNNLLPPPWKVKDSRGQTALYEAFRTDHVLFHVIKLDRRYHNEAFSEVNEYGETVVHLVARCGRQYLNDIPCLHDGLTAAWEMRDVDGFTPILRAAHCGHATLVKKFTETQKTSIRKSDYQGRNALHHLFTSTVTNSVELMELITYLDSSESLVGLDELIKSQDDDGNTPLHLAIIAGKNFRVAEDSIRHFNKVKPVLDLRNLLEKILNKDGKSIKHLITTCESNLKELLPDDGPPRWSRMGDDIYKAAKEGDVDFFRRLSDDEPWNCVSHDGSNIFHVALRYRHMSIVSCGLRYIFNYFLFQWNDSKGDTPLHLAARLPSELVLSFFEECRTTWLKFPIKATVKQPWKVKNQKGNTYLHEAARFCNYKLIFSELLRGEDIQDVNCCGETVLHVLAKYATNTAKDFLKNMTEQMQSLIYIQDFEGFTPILRALQYGRLGVATLLIQQCPQAIEIPDKKGGTILHHLKALVVDRVDDVTDIFPVWDEFFKLDGIDDLRIVQNEDGNTALHLAIIDGDNKKTKYLMEKCLHSENKQELDTINNVGQSVFDLVALKAHIPAMKELQPLVSRNYIKERDLMDRVMDDELYWAAVEGKVQIFGSAANDSITDDAESRPPTRPDAYFRNQTPSGSNIIHIALRHGKANTESFIDIALKNYPILSIRPDNNGDTPLHLAAKWKSGVAIVKLLIDTSEKFLQDESNKAYHAAPWAVKNYKGSFPIHEALQSDNLEAADALLNCDVEAASRVNDLGDTPLHSLAKNGFSIEYEKADMFVKKLLDKSNRAAYVRDDEGLTPLICAARSSRLHVAQAILKHRPQSAYIRDLCGRTFLHLLRYTGEDVDESLDGTLFKETGKQLFKFPEASAQRLVQDYDGNTPLLYAIINGNSIAAIVLTYKCLEDKEQREFGLVNKKGQTIPDLLALHEVPNEIIEQIKKKVPTAVYLARSSYGIRKTEMKYSANALSVVAALLATITFAAGFQVPGGYNQDKGFPIHLGKPAFIVFIIANTIAMCCSMLCLFLLLWVMGIGKIHGSLKVLDISIILIRLSFYLTLLAFTTGVFVTTVAKSLWLGILVIGLGTLTFLLTFRFPFITAAQYSLSATGWIKKFIKNVKSKCKLASPTQGTNVIVNQTSQQDRTTDLAHE